MSVIQSAHDTVLNEEELHVIDTSLFTVQQAVHHRISALQGLLYTELVNGIP